MLTEMWKFLEMPCDYFFVGIFLAWFQKWKVFFTIIIPMALIVML